MPGWAAGPLPGRWTKDVTRMNRMNRMNRLTRRPLVLLLAAAGFLLLGTPVADAHVEATVQSGQPGSGPVVVGFTAEAESSTAGIAGIRTQLPSGVPPESVTLASGPAGWSLTTTPDGFRLQGPALPVHTDARYGIRFAGLPTDRARLSFQTWVRYTDGHEDAWTQQATPVDPDPESPAPSIAVAAASGGAGADAPGSATPLADAASPTAPPSSSAAPGPAATGSSAGTIAGLVVLGVLVVGAAGVGLWYLRARSHPSA